LDLKRAFIKKSLLVIVMMYFKSRKTGSKEPIDKYKIYSQKFGKNAKTGQSS